MADEYNPWITLKKFVYSYFTSLVGVLIPFTITFVQDYDWPQEIIYYIPVIVAFLVALENWYKHRNDGK